jgi:hypothetical protein
VHVSTVVWAHGFPTCSIHPPLLLLLLLYMLLPCMQTAADQIAANYHSVAAGKGPLAANLVERSRGY